MELVNEPKLQRDRVAHALDQHGNRGLKDLRFQEEGDRLRETYRETEARFAYLKRRSAAYPHRQDVEAKIKEVAGQVPLPPLTDEIIRQLETHTYWAATRYYSRYPFTPYHLTRQEEDLVLYLQECFAHRPDVQIFPRLDPVSKRVLVPKLTVGPFVPDIAVFGLRPWGVKGKPTALLIEVNGEVHDVEKGTKDWMNSGAAAELGFFVWSVSNDEVYDRSFTNSVSSHVRSFCEELLSDQDPVTRRRRLPVKASATEAIRRRVALFSIAAWLPFDTIESIVRADLGTTLSLDAGFEALRSHPIRTRGLKAVDTNRAPARGIGFTR